MDSFIRTSTGQCFEFPYGKGFHFEIEGIAHALAHICRFGGHCNRFYSVAQHSLLVASLVPPEHRLAALLHDAHEAFIGDLVSPLKQFMPEYRRVEAIVEANLRKHFGVPEVLDPLIRHADLVALATEARDLTSNQIEQLECLVGILPVNDRVTPMRPWIAKKAFLYAFAFFTNNHQGER